MGRLPWNGTPKSPSGRKWGSARSINSSPDRHFSAPVNVQHCVRTQCARTHGGNHASKFRVRTGYLSSHRPAASGGAEGERGPNLCLQGQYYWQSLHVCSPPSAGCGPGRTLLTLAFGPGSALGGSSFACVPGTLVGNGLAGSAGKYTPEDNFGSSGISYSNGTTFLAQPGVYLVQVTIPAVTTQPANTGATNAGVSVQLEVPPSVLLPQIFGESGVFAGPPPTAYVPVNGNQILQISAPNSVVDFLINFSAPVGSPQLPQGCQIVFTRLQ
jgi:hypothetical protein